MRTLAKSAIISMLDSVLVTEKTEKTTKRAHSIEKVEIIDYFSYSSLHMYLLATVIAFHNAVCTGTEKTTKRAHKTH